WLLLCRRRRCACSSVFPYTTLFRSLVEVACIVTDSELNQLDDGVDVIIKPPPESLEQMSEVVREMHTASGLLPELATGVTLAERSEEHTSELQSRENLVCRLLLA